MAKRRRSRSSFGGLDLKKPIVKYALVSVLAYISYKLVGSANAATTDVMNNNVLPGAGSPVYSTPGVPTTIREQIARPRTVDASSRQMVGGGGPMGAPTGASARR